MQVEIPSIGDLRTALRPLKPPRLQELADASGVPFTTLVKLRNGQTANPRLDTVRALLPHLLIERPIKRRPHHSESK